MTTSNAVGTTTGINAPGRCIDLLAVPYDEMSYLTQNPAGERVAYGAFADACREPSKVYLFRGHDHAHPIGRAVALWEERDGLHGTFIVRESALGDEALADVLDGYANACSVGFRPMTSGRGQQGETVVMAADLKEVSLLTLGAYDSARVLAVRRPTDQPGVSMSRLVRMEMESPSPSSAAARTSSPLRSAPPARGKLGTLRL